MVTYHPQFFEYFENQWVCGYIPEVMLVGIYHGF
jgi:hypothetical protein